VSISLGISGLTKSAINKVKVAMTFGLFQGGLFGLGAGSIAYIHQGFTSLNQYIAAILLLVLGLKMIKEAIQTKANTCPHQVCLGLGCDKDRCDRTGQYLKLSLKLLLTYGIATSIDAFAAGISYALNESDFMLASMIIGIITLVFSYMGVIFGGKIKHFIGNKANLLGGIILIILSIQSFF
jgi:manganese efflux pump family protein